MSLSSIVQVTIDQQTTPVSRTGFGTPMIMSAEAQVDSRFPTTAKIYTDISELGSTGDNFDTAGVAFLKAQAIFGQSPKPTQLVIGKRASLPLMTQNLIPIAKNLTSYTIKIGGRGVLGSDVETFTFVSDATATVAEIIAGLVALINAGAQNVLATDNGPGTSMDIEAAASPGGAATAGKPFTAEFERSLWVAQNTTPDPGIVADITTVRTAIDGNDDWYALHLDSFGFAEINATAVHIETLVKIFLGTTSDADALTAATTDIFSVLQALSLRRTAVEWHENPHTGLGEGWAGGILPLDPGSVTWKFKTVATVAPSILTPAEIVNLQGKNGNFYRTLAGVNITCDGKMAGGEFIDITRGIDFITARLQENIFGRLVNLPKIAFTDEGIAIVESEVRGVMDLGISQGIFSPDPPPTVTVPAANDVDVNDRANRILPDVKFTAQLAGAIHTVQVQGTVTV
jgi:hypothetical protein